MTTYPFRTAAATAALLALLGGGSNAEELAAWRLFVADHAEPRVTAIDAANGAILESFVMRGPATLFRSDSGRSVFAVQGAAGAVTGISTGIAFEDHGDHGDIEVTAPALAGIEILGTMPVHLVEHDGIFAAFFDGEGAARIFSERDVLEQRGTIREVRTAAPHHGVAVAYGSYTLLSEPNSSDPNALPVGIRVVDAGGATVGDVHACPDLHGEASSGNLMLFACDTGVLVVSREDAGGPPAIRHLAYGAALPDGKSTTLIGGHGLQYFLGNYGADKLVLIDPTADDAFRLVGLPTRRVHFAVDPLRPKFAYVFTEDGQLHRLDVVSGEITGSLALTEPYSMDGHWSDPRPRIAVAGDRIVVTDPLSAELQLVDAVTFEQVGTIEVPGLPFNIVTVGGAGKTHPGQ